MEANWVPFEFVDGTGQLAGFDVELAQELGRRLGLEVQFVPNLSFDGLYDALTAGRVDVVISAVVVDMGRSADFAYSVPYFDAGQVLVVGPEGAGIEGLPDLAGRTLAVELGSGGDSVARRWARRLPGLTLLHTPAAGAALDAVAAGRAEAALTDRTTALMALDGYAEAGLYISGEPVTGEQYAVVTLRESGALLRVVNRALVAMREDGTLGRLEGKWLGP
jgi:ABC-type amino acid transport substrate-binding protein